MPSNPVCFQGSFHLRASTGRRPPQHHSVAEVRRDGDEDPSGQPRPQHLGQSHHHPPTGQPVLVGPGPGRASCRQIHVERCALIQVGVSAGTSTPTWRRCWGTWPAAGRCLSAGWSGSLKNRPGTPTSTLSCATRRWTRRAPSTRDISLSDLGTI